jgi:glycosyltransferase involved in cell wall biosynthesis
LLAAADVAVCPRIACFGFPIKLLNYMAAGKAIVVARGSAKCISHLEDGLVAGDDAGMIAEGILRLLRDSELAHRLGEAARHTVESRYRWSHAVRRVERCYDRLVGRGAEFRLASEQPFMEVKP